MKLKRLLKKLCVFNIVTLLSCNLVPNRTFAATYNVPVCGETDSTIPLEDSQLPEGSISITPTQFTGENVTLNITINKKEADPAAAEFKQAANCFASAVDSALAAKNDSGNKQKWVDLAYEFKKAASHTAEAAKSDVVSATAGAAESAYAAAESAKSAESAAYAAVTSASAAAESAAYAAYAKSAAYAAYAKSAAYAAYAAYAAAYAAEAAKSDVVSASAKAAANYAFSNAEKILGYDEANKYELTSEEYKNWDEDNFTDAKEKAQAAADAIVGKDFVDVIYGETATHNLWVRLKAKTKDAGGNDITPAPSNANEDTEWIKVTNITPSEGDPFINVSADMGKALMPGDYNVYVILNEK